MRKAISVKGLNVWSAGTQEDTSRYETRGKKKRMEARETDREKEEEVEEGEDKEEEEAEEEKRGDEV